MKTILVPIDFSPVTRRVMAEAAALARALCGRMVVLNVTEPKRIMVDHSALQLTIGELHRHAANARNGRKTAPVSGDSLQLIGEPISTIVEQANKLSADYIILGSHGHSALYDLFVGSTAAGVVQRAKCPVMIVPPRNRPASTSSKRSTGQRPAGSRHRLQAALRLRGLATRAESKHLRGGT